MVMNEAQKVRFTKDSRDGSYSKGQFGQVESLLAAFPAATADIYLARMDSGVVVWTTSDDVQEWNQLSLI